MARRLSSVSELVREAVSDGRVNASGWVRVNCPFCPDRAGVEDTKHSFAFKPSSNGYICNRCGIKGYLDGVPVGSKPRKPGPTPVKRDFPALWASETRAANAAQPAYTFLSRRGFSHEDVRAADMRVALTGRYAGRVVVPHTDVHGVWHGFSARLWEDLPGSKAPKVLYPPGMDRDRLYNEHVLQVETNEPALIVEGVLDAVWYLPDVVACLGKPTEAHMPKFLNASRPIVFCLDGDAWEEGVAWANRCALRGAKHVFHVKLLPGEDPNSIDPKWLYRQIDGLQVQRALARRRSFG